ncbi:MAG: hypothetical protein ACP5RI_02900 [Candidatus Micrarchaeia archaeon]|uniref:hypothetical protein n=1 Tax=Caldisericum sp. TaxID=2499687 RepID=UPI003D096966
MRKSKLDNIKVNFKDKTNIYYTDVFGLEKRLKTETNLNIIVDEGYFAALNLKAQESKVKALMSTLTAVRNRGHYLILNFVTINRAAKMLLEIADYWIHKPSLEWGILYAKDRTVTPADPWYVDKIIKADTPNIARNALLRNPNYIVQFRVPIIKKSIFEKYENEKLKAQSVDIQENEEKIKETKATIVKKIVDDYNKGIVTDDNLVYVLRQQYKLPPLLLNDIENEVKKYIAMEEYLKWQSGQTNDNK